jgi:hypothetical protein
VGLAVFASDALSSTAYATQEILMILAIAGTMAFGYAFPISLAIVALMAIVTISYEQTVHAYSGGGGAYIVARDNLGELPAQTAGAALLTDYILTVSVSIAAGVAQITSAYPALFAYRVPLAVLMVLFIMVINLRGVKESGTATSIIECKLLLAFIGVQRPCRGGIVSGYSFPIALRVEEMIQRSLAMVLIASTSHDQFGDAGRRRHSRGAGHHETPLSDGLPDAKGSEYARRRIADVRALNRFLGDVRVRRLLVSRGVRQYE